MSSSNKTQHRIQLEPRNFDRLQDIAAEFGFLHKAGKYCGKVGSVSSLLDAIAAGEIIVTAPTGRKE